MSIANKYKFFIESASIALTEVQPLSDTLEYSYEKSNLTRNLIKTVGSEVVLYKSEYNLLKTLDDAGTCEQINFYIDVFCGGVWVRDFTGVIKLRKCVFDVHNCKVKLGIEHNDITKCVEDKSQEKFNLFNVPFKPVAFEYQGYIESANCPPTNFNNVPISNAIHPTNRFCATGAPLAGWTVIENLITNITAGSNSGFFNCTISTMWKRQRVDGSVSPPLGSGWIGLIGFSGSWVRSIPTTPDTVNSYGDYSNPLAGDIKEVNAVSTLYKNATPQIYDNGLYLADVFTYLVNTTSTACTYTIISDFFSINPDGTHPTNIAYTNAISTYYNLIIYKTADVKRPNASAVSTGLFISLDELIENLKVLFQVEVSIYEVSGVKYFRIEHESYYDTVTGLDISAKPLITGKIYSYENEKQPITERFYFATQTDETGGTFDGYPIQYSKDCADPKTIIEKRAGLTYTNMKKLFENEGYPDDSITIAACGISGGSTFVISDNELNDYMTIPRFQTFFLYYNRPFATGTINGIAKTFVQSRLRKEEVSSLEINECSINVFDSNKLVNSFFGWGKVLSAKYDCKSCKLVVTLVH